jgi:hypothetical protein
VYISVNLPIGLTERNSSIFFGCRIVNISQKKNAEYLNLLFIISSRLSGGLTVGYDRLITRADIYEGVYPKYSGMAL